MRIAAIFSPLCALGAFLCFANGFFLVAVPLAGIALLLVAAFPIKRLSYYGSAYGAAEPSDKLRDCIRMAIFILVTLWGVSLPAYSVFMEGVYSDHSLWDWRIILAAFIWSGHMIYSNLRVVSSSSDDKILAFYDYDRQKN